MSGHYLRPDVVIEPVFHQWLVDVFLVPPAQAALTLNHTLVPILRSYVASPKSHAVAAADPALAGGPFLDLDPARVDEASALLRRTEQDAAPLLQLAKDLRALDALVVAETSGAKLAPLYKKIPDGVKGFVELSYDFHHRARWRPLEGLLYRSRYFQESAQALVISIAQGDRRSFAYSTPRFSGPDRLLAPVPFADERVSLLARARWEPVDPRGLADALGVTGPLFDSLFTNEPPPPRPRYDGAGMRVSYYGHACILVETADVSVLIDPSFAVLTQGAPERRSYTSLPEKIDFVLITHAHADHFNPEALLQLRHRVGEVVVPASGGALADPSLERLLRALGFPRVHSVRELDTVDVPGGQLTAVPFFGEHGDLDIHAKAGYAVSAAGATVLFGADATGLQPEVFDLVRAQVGPLDALFAAMEPHGAPLSWGYGAFFPKPPPRKIDLDRGQRAATQEELIQMVQRLRPKRFFNYAMGQEPWLQHLMGVSTHRLPVTLPETDPLTQFCRQEGIQAERLYGHRELRLPG